MRKLAIVEADGPVELAPASTSSNEGGREYGIVFGDKPRRREPLLLEPREEVVDDLDGDQRVGTADDAVHIVGTHTSSDGDPALAEADRSRSGLRIPAEPTTGGLYTGTCERQLGMGHDSTLARLHGPVPHNAGTQRIAPGVEENRSVGSLLVVTGPPGAGKSSVARILADAAPQSVLIEGDAFFGFLASGAIEPWLPASNDQNTVVTKAAASAAGAFATGGFTTVYDGVVGPWFLPTFSAATGLERLDYAILLPPVEVCVQRVATRPDHGFTDEAATRKMHAEFVRARLDDRHVLRDPSGDATSVAELIESAREAGELTHAIR